MRFTSVLGAAAASAAVLLTTACGSLPGEGGLLGRHSEFLDQSAVAMAKQSFADMRKVTSLRLLGSLDIGEYGMADIDIRLQDSACKGSFDTDEGEMRFLQVGKSSWVTADDDMMATLLSSDQRAEQLAKKFSGTWFRTADAKGLDKLCDLDKFLSSFKVDEGDREKVGVGDVEEIGDVEAVPLSGRDGKKKCTLWVSVNAPHHVVKMTMRKRGDATQEIYFEEFGVEVDIEAPDKKDVVVVP